MSRGKALGSSFSEAKQRIFLEVLARTCNVREAARTCGTARETIYGHRRSNPAFRAAWEEALAMGMLELETSLLARALRVKSSADENEEGELQDPDLAKWLFKEGHGRMSRERSRGGKPASVDWPAVEDWFVAKLKLVKKRIERGEVELER